MMVIEEIILAYLEQFTDDEREFLVSLPYRTGFWVSQSDDVGGDEADELESQALEAIITGFTEDFCKSEFVEELMRQALASKDQWPKWEETAADVPEDCRRAVRILEAQLEHKVVLSFKQNLIEIATTVAMAYREFDETQPFFVKTKVYGRYFWGCMIAAILHKQPPDLDEILNISQAEQTALTTLYEALQVGPQSALQDMEVA